MKDGNVFYTDIYYIYENNNENIYTFIYIKKLKKCLCLFIKIFSNYQAAYQKELYLLLKKSGSFFSRVEHRERLKPSAPPVCFHSLFKDPPLPPSFRNKLFIGKGLLEEIKGANDDDSAFMVYFLNQAKSFTSES